MQTSKYQCKGYYSIDDFINDMDEIREIERAIDAKRQAQHEAFLKQHGLTEADYQRMKASGEIVMEKR